jgi:hypothetical protein
MSTRTCSPFAAHSARLGCQISGNDSVLMKRREPVVVEAQALVDSVRPMDGQDRTEKHAMGTEKRSCFLQPVTPSPTSSTKPAESEPSTAG